MVAEAPGAPFVLTDVSVREPVNDEVLVRVDAVGVCHADLAAREGAFPVPLPAVLGHEGTGLVVDVGPAVRRVHPGDRVVLTFEACYRCPSCEAGSLTQCRRYMELNFGAPGLDPPRRGLGGEHSAVWTGFFGQSSFTDLAIASERNAVVVRGDVPAHLLAPLGCAVQTGAGAVLNVARPRAGAVVVIVGLGPVGLSAVTAAARFTAASAIIAADLDDARLDMATSLGATDVLNPRDHQAYAELARRGGADLVIECSGSPRVLPHVLPAMRAGGICVVVGAPPFGSTAPLDVAAVVNGSLTIRGTVEGDSTPRTFLPWLADRVAEGSWPLEPMVRTYPLADAQIAALDMAAGRTIKPVLVV